MNIMIDLETLGTGADAVITQIGAVAFTSNEIASAQLWYVDIEDQIRAGRKVDADTLVWWMSRSKAARDGFIEGAKSSDCLAVALYDLTLFITHENAKIWGNGSDFDNAILAHAYKQNDQAYPAHFWNNRCYRTVKSLFPDVELQRQGTHHDALDDAKTQAQHLIDIAKTHALNL